MAQPPKLLTSSGAGQLAIIEILVISF